MTPWTLSATEALNWGACVLANAVRPPASATFWNPVENAWPSSPAVAVTFIASPLADTAPGLRPCVASEDSTPLIAWALGPKRFRNWATVR